jgi:paraquat-inducible protein A
MLYIPANLYPILTIHNLFGRTNNTIIGGVIALWDSGSYAVAAIIMFASVVVPILKFIVLLYLLISVHYPVRSSKTLRHRLYTITEWIGPWSMVDVFVVSILVGLVRYQSFQILAGPGATAFVLMVFFTMLAALSFDPRLIREHPQTKRRRSDGVRS